MKHNSTEQSQAFNEWYPTFQSVLATGKQSKVIEIPSGLSILARSQLRKALSQAGLGFVRMMTSPVATIAGYAQQIEKDSQLMVMGLHNKQLQVALAEVLIEEQTINCNMIFSLNLPFGEPEDLLKARGVIGKQLTRSGIEVNGVDELLIYDGEDKTVLKLACCFNRAPSCWTRPPRAAKLGIDIQNEVLSGKNKDFLLLDITDSPIEIVHCQIDGREHHVGTFASGTCIPDTEQFELTCANKSKASIVKFQSTDVAGDIHTLLEMDLPAYAHNTTEVTFTITIDIDANSQHHFKIENRLLNILVSTYL